MKRLIVGFVSLTIAALLPAQAFAWAHANAWGGGTFHTAGSAAATGRYSGSAERYAGGGWSATSRYGTTAAGGYDHYYGGNYSWYHPPTAVHYYNAGCYDCGGWGVAGAAAAGAAVGLAATSEPPITAGFAAGGIYTTLPGSCTPTNYQGRNYYVCGDTWFIPSYGANGVYYRVVPTP